MEEEELLIKLQTAGFLLSLPEVYTLFILRVDVWLFIFMLICKNIV